MVGKWDDIHWVRTSADIPKNDLLNYTVDELARKYPKIPNEDLMLERHLRFPRRFPMPAGYKNESLRYRRELIVRSPTDLRDSIFAEHKIGEIRAMYPQFTEADLNLEKVRREIRDGMEAVRRILKTGGADKRDMARARVARMKTTLEGLGPLTPELKTLKEQVDEMDRNLT